MKKTFLLLFIFLMSGMAYAQTSSVLSLAMHDGTFVTFFLKDKPRVTFVEDYMEIVAETSQAKVKRSDIAEIKFLNEDIDAGIDESKVNEFVEIGSETIFVGDLKDGCRIKVLTIDGRVIIDEQAGDNGSVTISLNVLPAGIYILNYNNTTIKFIKP